MAEQRRLLYQLATHLLAEGAGISSTKKRPSVTLINNSYPVNEKFRDDVAPSPFFQGEGWGGVCFLACETSRATPSQPPPWQGEELFEAFFGIYLTNRPKMYIRESPRVSFVSMLAASEPVLLAAYTPAVRRLFRFILVGLPIAGKVPVTVVDERGQPGQLHRIL